MNPGTAWLRGWRGLRLPTWAKDQTAPYLAGSIRRAAAIRLGLWYPGCGRPKTDAERARLKAAFPRPKGWRGVRAPGIAPTETSPPALPASGA